MGFALRNLSSARRAVKKALIKQTPANCAMTPTGKAKIAFVQAKGTRGFRVVVEALVDPPDPTETLPSISTADHRTAPPACFTPARCGAELLFC